MNLRSIRLKLQLQMQLLQCKDGIYGDAFVRNCLFTKMLVY